VGPRSTSTNSTAKCRNSMPSGRSASVITAAARQCARRNSRARAKGEVSPGRSVAREVTEGVVL
jgi:hypothetical protein